MSATTRSAERRAMEEAIDRRIYELLREAMAPRSWSIEAIERFLSGEDD